MKKTKTSKLGGVQKMSALTVALLATSVVATQAADISWSGGTADYTTAANWGGTVPGTLDNAINDNGTNNKVQISVGNPDWAVNQILAGYGVAGGAFVQNGQLVSLIGTNIFSPAFHTSIRLGVAAGSEGVYTLNAGDINYGAGAFNVGELGAGTLNVHGGTITGNASLAIGIGLVGTPTAVNATVDAGAGKSGYTWFEQGFYPNDGGRGVPPANTTFTHAALADHSYMTAPSYAANNSLMINSAATEVTVTLTAPAAYSALSFLGSASYGPMTVNYIVYHADATTEAGSISVADWYNTTDMAWRAGGRVSADGSDFQINGAVNESPNLLSMDIALANTGSPVTSVKLTYTTGVGTACLLAVSGSTGGNFDPIGITGYNADMIIEAGAQCFVAGSSTFTNIMNQTAGSIVITNGGQFFVGNYGNGIYNLSGGTNTVSNYIVFGRSGGNGTVNMTGGALNQAGGGNLLVGSGYRSLSGYTPAGLLNQSGGAIDCRGEFLVPEGSPAVGTYNFSGGVLNVHNWIAVGRNGGSGTLNISGNAVITRDNANNGGANFVVGAGGQGVVTQDGGFVTNLFGQTWIGENSAGTWHLNGGVANLGVVHIAQLSTASGDLNLNGGTLIAGEITTGSPAVSFSSMSLNGATVQASQNSAAFIHDLYQATVAAGGAIFDSQAYNVTIPQPLLDAGGGVTKLGSGTVSLTGANNYSGATTVSAGTLEVTTASTGTGDYTVANGAALGVKVVGAVDTSVSPVNATFASPAATLNVDYNGLHPTSLASAPLNVSSTLTVNGTVTINVLDSAPAIGQFPLVKYGSKTGAGTFTLGTLPAGVVATLSNNVANSSIDLVVSQAVAVPRWDGTVAGGVWDINTTQNWIDLGALPTVVPAVFKNGMAVLFDDNATGTTTVDVSTTVTPSGVTVDNTYVSYTMVGLGKISGTGSLVKKGTSTLAIQNTGGNNYTGPTVVQNGTLTISSLANGGVPSAIGASSASPTNLVIGGTLSYVGAPVTVDRGFSFANTNSIIDAQGDLTFTGPLAIATNASGNALNKTGLGTLTLRNVGTNEFAFNRNPGLNVREGTMVLDGSAGYQYNHSINELRLGSIAGTGGNLVLTNTTLYVDAWLGGGRSSSLNTTSSLTLFNSQASFGNVSLGYADGVAGYQGTQVLTLNGNSTLTNRNGDINLGESSGANATVAINGTSVLYSAGRGLLSMTANSPSSLTIADSGQFIINSYFSVANGNGAVATATVKNNGFFRVANDFNISDTGTSTGTMNIQDSAVADGGTVYIGKANGTLATVNMTGGTLKSRGHIRIGMNSGSVGNVTNNGGAVVVQNELWVGEAGTGNFVQTAGSTWSTNWVAIGRNGGSTGNFNISGGSFAEMNGGSRLIVGSSGNGTLTISGTAQVSSVGNFQVGENGGSKGTVNLNGGSLTVPQIVGGAGASSAINLNGGTLVARENANAAFLSGLGNVTVTVQSGGVTVNSGTNAINIGQNLLAGGNDGGLTKTGNGQLYLNGVNTYTNVTTVSAGTLGGSGTIAGSVTVASGATLAGPNGTVGTLTVNGNLTLAAGSTNSLKLASDTATSDKIAGLVNVTYAGTLVVSNNVGTPVTTGSYQLFVASGTKSGNFSSVVVLPAGSGNGSFDPATGTLTITPGTPPVVNPPMVSGGNLILTGTGGVPGGSYAWLTSTNVATPVAQWVTNILGTFDGAGAFSNGIPVSASEPARFFRLKTP